MSGFIWVFIFPVCVDEQVAAGKHTDQAQCLLLLAISSQGGKVV